MMLARIEPGPVHSELRTFECLKCKHAQKVLAEDPMKAKARWQDSGLNPPREVVCRRRKTNLHYRSAGRRKKWPKRRRLITPTTPAATR